MELIFVHGWSVTDTSTYGRLPEALAEQASAYDLDINIHHVWLGRYISFHDEVTVSDIARAMNTALQDVLAHGSNNIPEFSCITHSTGGPVVREWLDRFYGADKLMQSPLKHLVMLAPANHGSPLAALGKERVGRIKAWFSGVEPGKRILDWLSLGSPQQNALAAKFLNYKPADNGFYPFVLTGQATDKRLYDFLNAYLVEKGSDGVVRVAGANMNFTMVRLIEDNIENKDARPQQLPHGLDQMEIHSLKLDGGLLRPCPVPLGVIPGASHSGNNKGIMGSVLSPKTKSKPQVQEILKCLQVNTLSAYEQRAQYLQTLTETTQAQTHTYAQLIFNVLDDEGEAIRDYDLFLLGGDGATPNELTKGFHVDKQRNASNPDRLVYYVDYTLITRNKLSGFRIFARPETGFSYYHAVEFRSNGFNLNDTLRPNESLYIEIVLQRCVAKNLFTFDNASEPKLHKTKTIIPSDTRHDFKSLKPL